MLPHYFPELSSRNFFNTPLLIDLDQLAGARQ
jgi:hypothetical protein